MPDWANEAVGDLWQSLGSQVTTMDAPHHDLVLAITSHIPHLIAFTIVGTATGLAESTQREVIQFSAGDSVTLPASRPATQSCGAIFF
jgi:prephenate dehydrogenase